MISSNELLQLAFEMITFRANEDTGFDVCLRRSVSTSYYALFHHIQKTAADLLVGTGADHTRPYRTVYRSFTHGFMRDACARLLKSDNPHIKIFAEYFDAAQQWRHDADYDPGFEVSYNTAYSQHARARFAMANLDALDHEDRIDVVIQLMLKERKSGN